MFERHLKHIDYPLIHAKTRTKMPKPGESLSLLPGQVLTQSDIAGNYYPVPSAIAMRDFSGGSNL